MPTAAAGLFVVDFLVRPFFKIYEKMPYVMLVVTILLYGLVGYIVVKSVYLNDQHR